MKRILLATIAISLLATPMAYAAPAQKHFSNSGHHQQQYNRPHWEKGKHLPKGTRGIVVRDYGHYHLRKPPVGQHWVNVNNDYLLIGITSGIISSIIQSR